MNSEFLRRGLRVLTLLERKLERELDPKLMPVSERRYVLDEIGECLNYIAFMDEKDPEFVRRVFGGDPEIITSVSLVQAILSDLYDKIDLELSQDPENQEVTA